MEPIMDETQKKELQGIAGHRMRFQCALAPHTTFKVGGPVDALYDAETQEELRAVLRYLKRASLPFMTVGLGSNLLVRDGGLDGVVIRLKGDLARIETEKTPTPCLRVGAGTPIPQLMAFCRESGFSGLEFLAGIPGTVGGAVAMNAGAFGRETQSRVASVDLLDPMGEIRTRRREDLRFSYRALALEAGLVILRVRLRVRPEGGRQVGERIAAYLKKRKASQPLEYPSAGSVFKNPAADYAGRLIERAGLKGTRIGGAVISKKHANYIVNTGGATAEDVLALVRLAQQAVKQASGIALEPEIRVVGRG